MAEQIDMLEVLLGRGMSYPFAFSAGTTQESAGIEKIYQALSLLYDTMVGEMFFMPEFGSKMRRLLFEQNDAVLAAKADAYAREAIDVWIPRIGVKQVRVVEPEDHVVLVLTEFFLRSVPGASYTHEYSMAREV